MTTIEKPKKFRFPASITIWDDPSSMLQSQYGNVTYRVWCEKEVDRIRGKGKWARVGEVRGKIAVVRSTEQ